MNKYENKYTAGAKQYISTDMVAAQALQLDLKSVEFDGCIVRLKYAKDDEYKYCAVGKTSMDAEFIEAAGWCSLALYSMCSKYPKLACPSILRGAVMFWIKLRYYVFNKRPNVDFESTARRVFPVLFGDYEAEIESVPGFSYSDYCRGCFIVNVAAFLGIMKNSTIKRAKLLFDHIFGYARQTFVVHKNASSLSGDVPELNVCHNRTHKTERSGVLCGPSLWLCYVPFALNCAYICFGAFSKYLNNAGQSQPSIFKLLE